MELILIVILVALVVAGAMWAIGTASRGAGTPGGPDAAGRDVDTPGSTTGPGSADGVTDRSTRPPVEPDRPVPGSRTARAEHPGSPASRPRT